MPVAIPRASFIESPAGRSLRLRPARTQGAGEAYLIRKCDHVLAASCPFIDHLGFPVDVRFALLLRVVGGHETVTKPHVGMSNLATAPTCTRRRPSRSRGARRTRRAARPFARIASSLALLGGGPPHGHTLVCAPVLVTPSVRLAGLRTASRAALAPRRIATGSIAQLERCARILSVRSVWHREHPYVRVPNESIEATSRRWSLPPQRTHSATWWSRQ